MNDFEKRLRKLTQRCDGFTNQKSFQWTENPVWKCEQIALYLNQIKILLRKNNPDFSKVAMPAQLETFKSLACKEMIGFQTVTDGSFFYWDENTRSHELMSCDTQKLSLNCSCDTSPTSNAATFWYRIQKISDVVANQIDRHVLSVVTEKAGLRIGVGDHAVTVLENIISGINIADNRLESTGSKKRVTWIHCSESVANVLAGFSFAVESYLTIKYHGVRLFGEMLTRGIKIYCDESYPQNKVLLGTQGNRHADCGAFLCVKNLILPDENDRIYADLSVDFVNPDEYFVLSLN